MQLDEPERGFSFQADGLLIGACPARPTAADLLNTLTRRSWPTSSITAKSGARAIARYRPGEIQEPLTRTRSLSASSRRFWAPEDRSRHPATARSRRYELPNDELGEVAAGPACAERLLKPGGCLVVVTFHSPRTDR